MASTGTANGNGTGTRGAALEPADSSAHTAHEGTVVTMTKVQEDEVGMTFSKAVDAVAPLGASQRGSVFGLTADSSVHGGRSTVIVTVEDDEYPRSCGLVVMSYLRKWRGGMDTSLPRPPPLELFFSWLGAFCGILLVAGLNQLLTPQVNLPLLVASFGASAVLIFGVTESKMAQPRNFIGGQVISALVGCSIRAAFHNLVWLSTAIGMSLALLAMQLTCTTHPPGGATALIAASAHHLGPWRGFQFVLTVFFGSLGMLVVALVVNNLSPQRRYPTFWW